MGPALAKTLQDTQAKVRKNAAIALRQIGEAASKASLALAERLNDDDGDVRAASMEALIQLGSHASPAMPTLLELLQHPKYHVREGATVVIKEVDPAALQDVDLTAMQRQISKHDRCAVARPGKCLCPTCRPKPDKDLIRNISGGSVLLETEVFQRGPNLLSLMNLGKEPHS